jgi:hypothetical protein
MSFVENLGMAMTDPEKLIEDDKPFKLTVPSKERESRRKVCRPKFEFGLKKRCGVECAVCSMQYALFVFHSYFKRFTLRV